MQTLFVGHEQLDAHLDGLAKHLTAMEDAAPEIFLPIGQSGEVVFEALMRRHISLQRGSYTVDFVRDRGVVEYYGASGQKIVPDIKDRRILILDGLISTGEKMAHIARDVCDRGATSAISFSLLLRRSARFMPTIWGLMIGDNDRVCLPDAPLDCYGLTQHMPSMSVHLRHLNDSDFAKPILSTGNQAVDAKDWQARLTLMKESSDARCTLVLEEGALIRGFVTVSTHLDKLQVHELAVDTSCASDDYFGRLFESLAAIARQRMCRLIQVHVRKADASAYQGWGFLPTDAEWKMKSEQDLLTLECPV